MFIATLLTAPTEPVLDASLADSLRNAWGGGDAMWLSPDEAVEFALPAMPENRWKVWNSLQTMGVDLIVQPTAGRRKALLLADMDSTMIEQECIDELADVAGVGPKVAAITAKAMNGELDFEAALIERVGTLKGQKISIIETVLNDRITFASGGKTLISTMVKNGASAVLVSGGFTDFTRHVSQKLGFSKHFANTLIVENGLLTGEVRKPILGQEAKVQTLHQTCQELGLSSDQVIAVGDGANDLPMLQIAGTGVALHAKPLVAKHCEIRINFGDLTALLYLQGYSKSEFAS